MTTVILVGLIVVLLAAAAYVGVLLVRRSRSAPAEAEPDTGPAPSARARWPTCSERRAAPVDESAGDQADALSGEELFVPQVPRQDGVAVPAVPDGPDGRAGGRCSAVPAAGHPGGWSRDRRRPLAPRRADDRCRAGRRVGDRAAPGRRRPGRAALRRRRRSPPS